MAGHSHRPSTNFKQSNKSHRSGTSKGALKDASKDAGRVQREHPKKSSGSSNQTKAARRNHAKQIQQQKRNALIASTRAVDAPRVVVCLSLTDDIEVEKVATSLFAADIEPRDGRTVWPVSIKHPRPTSLQLLCPSSIDSLYSTLDACTAADYVLLLLSPTVEVEFRGENLLRSLCAIGVPDHGVRGIVCGDSPPTSDVRKSLLSFSQHFFPSLTRLFAACEAGEASNLVRSLCEAAPKGITWREERGRVLVEEASRDESGSLRLTGVVRGAPMSANRLVHLPGVGDCQVEKILSASAARLRNGKAPAATMDIDSPSLGDGELILSQRDDDEGDDLRSVNSVDTLDGLQAEQTWPTADELASAPAALNGRGHTLPDAPEGTTPRLKRVPKGTSQYQAAWILEDDASDDDDDDAEEDEAMDEDDAASMTAGQEGNDDFELLDESAPPTAPSTSGRAISFAGGVDTADLDSVHVEKERERWRAAREEAQFPDEVDTPMHIPARERFARYRGLRSFRTSPWDPYENLPADYAKIFMFRDWRGVGRGVMRQEANDESAVQPGTRVTLIVRPPDTLASDVPLPLVAWALHKHEHKLSVSHCTVLRNTEFEDDVKSKDSLVLQLGPRRFLINPLFSQHTQANAGKGANNVHKFERFLPTQQGGAPAMATSYLPITFGTAVPSLFFRPDDAALIGSGSLHSCDPTRVIAKRILLTGHPVKVHKRTATIRYLFFNPEDVAYFKPVQLRTKKGRIGYIRESLGTHGLLKAGFDGPLDQMDTVCLNLYKRCFPKWSQLAIDGREQVAAGAGEMDVV